MTLPFSSAIWRPLVIATLIGMVLNGGILWLFVALSDMRQDDARWVAHTARVLIKLREVDEQLNDKIDTRPLLLEIQELTADNSTQQRRLTQLLEGSPDAGLVRVTTISLRAEEHRLMEQRVNRWASDARAMDWLMGTFVGLIGVLSTTTLLLIARVLRRQSRTVEVLALNADLAINALPESEAYADVKRTMEEVRAALKNRKI